VVAGETLGGAMYTIGWSLPRFIFMYMLTLLLLAVPCLFVKKRVRWVSGWA